MTFIDGEVRRKLGKLRLSEAVREEVVAEIADHLESVVEELKTNGVEASEAARRALLQLGDVDKLLKRIQRERTGAMRDSFRKVWLPAAAVILLVYVSQMIIYRLMGEPRTYEIKGSYYVYSWGWLVTVAVCGALGAWWSREVGGSVKDRIMVALAPAEAMAVLVVLVLPIETIAQLIVERRAPYFVTHPMMFLVMTLWVLHSAVPACVGALPFLRGGKPQARKLAL